MLKMRAAHRGQALFSLLRTAWTEYERDHARYLAGAMVYYALVSLVPLLLLLLGALGLLLRFSTLAASAQQEVLRGVEANFGTQLRATIQQLLEQLQQESIIATIISLVGLIFTASVLFRHLRLSFRAIWKYAPPLVAGSFWDAVRTTVLNQAAAFLMVLTGGALLLLALAFVAATQWLDGYLGTLPLLSRLTTWLLATLSPLGLATATFALLFRYLPPVPLAWRDVWLAALLCAIAWTVASELLTLYSAFFGSNRSAYGAIGVVLVIMLWMNLVSQMLFFGAEVCKVIVARRKAAL
jgi:membrane protein